MQKSAREVLRNKHFIRAGLIFAFRLIGDASVFVGFGVTDVELPAGTEVLHAELSIEHLAFHAAIRLIYCHNFGEDSAGQILISGRNFR